MNGICLTGPMRAGKDEVARYLCDHYGYTRFAFGDALKRLAHEIYPWVSADPKPRDLYQFMNVMRDYDPDVWVRHCFAKIRAEQSERKRLMLAPLLPVITDARQSNEVAHCSAKGYAIVRVNADLDTRIKRIQTAGDAFKPEDLTHETEKEIDSFDVDYEIDNGEGVTLVELHAQIDVVIRQMRDETSEIAHL